MFVAGVSFGVGLLSFCAALVFFVRRARRPSAALPSFVQRFQGKARSFLASSLAPSFVPSLRAVLKNGALKAPQKQAQGEEMRAAFGRSALQRERAGGQIQAKPFAQMVPLYAGPSLRGAARYAQAPVREAALSKAVRLEKDRPFYGLSFSRQTRPLEQGPEEKKKEGAPPFLFVSRSLWPRERIASRETGGLPSLPFQKRAPFSRLFKGAPSARALLASREALSFRPKGAPPLFKKALKGSAAQAYEAAAPQGRAVAAAHSLGTPLTSVPDLLAEEAPDVGEAVHLSSLRHEAQEIFGSAREASFTVAATPLVSSVQPLRGAGLGGQQVGVGVAVLVPPVLSQAGPVPVRAMSARTSVASSAAMVAPVLAGSARTPVSLDVPSVLAPALEETVPHDSVNNEKRAPMVLPYIHPDALGSAVNENHVLVAPKAPSGVGGGFGGMASSHALPSRHAVHAIPMMMLRLGLVLFLLCA